jgi:hypothetical protein
VTCADFVEEIQILVCCVFERFAHLKRGRFLGAVKSMLKLLASGESLRGYFVP